LSLSAAKGVSGEKEKNSKERARVELSSLYRNHERERWCVTKKEGQPGEGDWKIVSLLGDRAVDRKVASRSGVGSGKKN